MTSARPLPEDLQIGSFSETGPWVVEPDRMPWRRGAAALRTCCRRQLPALLRPRRLPSGRRLARVVAALGPGLTIWYLRDRRHGPHASRAALARTLRAAFGRLGPTYIKLGQILSAGQGIFPDELVGEFRLLRDRVPAEPFEEVRDVLTADLGRPLEAVFSAFDPVPVAAASIAQVHLGTLRSGEEVAIKVQRPRVATLVRDDLAVMSWLAPRLVGRIPVAALANPPALVELFAETIVEELDFRLEAENMLEIAAILADTGQRAIIVPRPHPELVTRRVLVMERLSGFAWDDVGAMRKAGIDTSSVVRAGMVAFIEGAMLYGTFHGDLHGGNMFVQPDGRVALLDFGITGRLDEPHRVAFMRLMMGATVNDVRMQIGALCDLGALPADADVDQLISDLGIDQPVVDPTSLTAEELTAQVRELAKALLGHGARMPKELMLYVKNLLFLDTAMATLAPDIDLLAEITRLATYFSDRYGERIAREVGVDPRHLDVDLDGVRASMGLGSDVEGITYRELRARREVIKRRLEQRERRARRRLRKQDAAS